MLTGSELALAGLAAVAAGLINALAGGGTLVSFPTLIAMGIPPVAANITNTVALCPGYLGGALAQRADLRGQGRRLLVLVPAGIAGGVAGGGLLLLLDAHTFTVLVPFLILMAAGLLAVQDRVKAWITLHASRAVDPAPGSREAAGSRRAILPVSLAAVYGGYFGPGLSVIILAVLGLFIDDNLTRLNALKQCLSLAVNTAAAIFFLFTGLVIWPLAIVMAAGALIGGAAGGTIAGRIDPARLRWTIVAIGIVVGIVFLVRL